VGCNLFVLFKLAFIRESCFGLMHAEIGLFDLSNESEGQVDSTHSVALDTSGSDHMTKTIVIAVCCVIAYLGIMAALTVYCLVHMVRARRMRKLQSNASNQRTGNPSNGLLSFALYMF
jgi:hypothetical protein